MKIDQVARTLAAIQAKKAEADRQRGKLSTLKELLNKEFQVETAEQARELLASLREEQAKAEAQMNAALENFAHAYPELIVA